MRLPFRDRREAGAALGRVLQERGFGAPLPVVLALPRGGVPVGFEAARELGAPLDIFTVRKLGVPEQPELAMGAIARGGVRVLNPEIARFVGEHDIEAVATREAAELERREQLYRGHRPATPVAGRVVILVDDGLATGASMRAAVQAVRALGPARVVVAVPVGATETCAAFAALADDCLCLATPAPFDAVGLWYDDFRPVSDTEVTSLLDAARATPGPASERQEHEQ